MARLAERNSVCEHCHQNIYKGIDKVATNSFDPDPKSPWIHEKCALEQEEAVKAVALGKTVTLEQFDKPGTTKTRRAPNGQFQSQRTFWYKQLSDEFLRLLTVDSVTKDKRRSDYNQAIFADYEDGGYAVFNGTDLHMVLDKFDQAVKNVERMS